MSIKIKSFLDGKCMKCGRTFKEIFLQDKQVETHIEPNEQFICDKCKELEGKHILPDMHLIMDKYDKNDIFVPILDDIHAKMEQNNESQETLEVTVDGTQYSFKCRDIDPNGNYFSVARNPNKCPICDKEYTDSEFICAIEHGTIQLKNICVDCYNKIFKGKE